MWNEITHTSKAGCILTWELVIHALCIPFMINFKFSCGSEHIDRWCGKPKKKFLSLLRENTHTHTHTHTKSFFYLWEETDTHTWKRVQESSECEGENWEAHGSVTWQHKNRLISLSLSRVFLLPITPLFIFHHSLLLWTLLSVTFIEPSRTLSPCTTIHNSAAAPLSYRSLLLIISQLPLTSSQSSLVIYASCRRSGATASSPSFFFVIFAYITDPFIN